MTKSRQFRGLSHKALALGVSALAAHVTGVAQAQNQSEGEDASSVTLTEIVVTAQRRGENLQSVPISVSAVTAELAESQGIRQLDDLGIAVPGLNMSRTVSAPLPFIRGVGTNSTNPGVEPPVAFYVDGVYYPSSTADVANFNNIERIEVLRGPQGTLFGRNTTGGLIQIVTRDPSSEFSGRARIGYGNYDTLSGNLYVTGGITENVAADLSVFYTDQNDGWGTNVTTGKDVHLQSDWGARTKWVYRGTNTQLTFSADFGETEGDRGSARQVLPGPTPGGAFTGVTFTGSIYDASANSPVKDTIKNYGAMFRVDHDFGPVRLASITGWRVTHRETFLDLDTSQFDYSSAHYDPDKTKSLSQELQLLSPEGSTVSWIAGLYYFDASAGFYPLQINNAALGPALYQAITSDIDTQSTAVFAQATFPLFTPNTKLTLGGRYTWDDKDLEGEIRTALAVVMPDLRQNNKWSRATYRLSLDHQINDDFMIYGSASTGFKSGIYNATTPHLPAVNPEKVVSYEAGFKSELFDRRARLNVAVFHAEYEDLQLTRFTGTSSLLLNAAEAKVKGLEAEGMFAVSQNLRITSTLALMDSEYTSFPNAVSFQTSPTTGLGVQTIIDATGNDIYRTPDLTYTLGLDYSRPTPFGEIGVNTAWYHNDGYYFEIDNQYKQPAYDLVNAELRWLSNDERYGVRLWSRNLLDKEYYTNKQTSNNGLPVGVPAEPRTYGLSFEMNF